MTGAVILFLVLIVPALLGIRSTKRMWAIVTFDDVSRRSPILVLLAVIATIVTAAASWFGVVAVLRLAEIPNLEWTAAVSTFLAAAVLLIPAAIERVVVHIARRDGGSSAVASAVDHPEG